MPPKERHKLQPRPNQEPLQGYHGWENVIPRDVRYDTQLPHQYQYPLGGQTRVSDVEPILTDFGSPYKNTRTREWYDQHSSPSTPEWQWAEGYFPQNYQEGIMSMADNRTSRNPNTWHQSPYFGMGGYDFVEDHAPEYLDYFQDIKDKDAMERDTNYQVTLPEHEKLGKLSGYKLLPEGVYPYANPSWIENNPSYGLDYMADLWGGKGRVGFRKGLDDDDYNAYANWEINW